MRNPLTGKPFYWIDYAMFGVIVLLAVAYDWMAAAAFLSGYVVVEGLFVVMRRWGRR